MSWEQRRRQASWRGLPFEWQTISYSLGRETVIHQFPRRDEPYVEQLSLAPEQFSVSGFVVGDDHDIDRARWRAEARKLGPGTLIHPIEGRIEVTLVKPGLTIDDNVDAQGKTSFRLELVRYAPRQYPEARVQRGQQLDSDNDALKAASSSAFAGSFTINGQPGWVRDSVTDQLEGLSSVVERALWDDWNTLTAEQWSAFDQARAAADPADPLLVTDPGAWSDKLRAVFDTLPFFDFARRFIALLGDDPIDSSVGSGSWDQDVANRLALVRRERRAALSVLVRTLTAGAYKIETSEQAESVRSLLLDLFDAELNREDTSKSPGLFRAVYDARLSSLTWLEGATASLSALRDFTPESTMPVVVISHRLYGTPDRVDEIMRLNAGVLEHPLFAYGGVPLRVRAS